MPSRSPDEWGELYRGEQPGYERLTEKLRGLLEELLEHAHIDHAPIEARTKSVASFVEKVGREEKTYGDPLTEMTDLSGIRIITYYPVDRARIGELIRREFVVDEANSTGEKRTRDPDQFGYESAHYVVSLPGNRTDLTDWAAFKGLKAEIQVRTVLQHAWAAISHKLDYKNEAEVPPEHRRQLFRLSALLELADEEFEDLRTNTAATEARVEQEVAHGNYDVPLSAASLDAYLERTEQHVRWARKAEALGFEPVEVPNEELRHYSEQGRAHLLLMLAMSSVETVAELDEMLTSDEWNESFLSSVVQEARKRDAVPGAIPLDVLVIIALTTRLVSQELIERTMFVSGIQEAMWAVVEGIHAEVGAAEQSSDEEPGGREIDGL